MQTIQATEISTISDAIQKANSAQLDCLWAILKYKEIGILRKVKCMAEVLNFDLDKACSELPVNENGYIVDYKTRHLIHDILLEKSKNVSTRS
jgi:hypothetical protein